MVLGLLNNQLIILAEKTLMMSEFALNGLKKMTRKCYWKKYIFNGYEPDNVITFHGIETEIPANFVADGLSFFFVSLMMV